MDNTENRFKHKGIFYVAHDSISGCFCCAGCENISLCANLPPCSDVSRKDKRSVIFVKSDADNFGDEE